MEVYFFFKKYYIALGKDIAIFLSQKGLTPNMASVLSLGVIYPLFYILYSEGEVGLVFWLLFFLCIQVKLVANAIDGIIARHQEYYTQSGRYLNVIVDIFPDIYIVGGLLIYLGYQIESIYILLFIMSIYLMGECLYIFKYKAQNLYYGKELRVIFYAIIFGCFYFEFSVLYLTGIYFIFLLIHNVGFYKHL